MGKISTLLTGVHGGDREALGAVLQAFRQYLTAVARRELGDDMRPKGGASDLVQETFLDAYRSIGSFHGRTEKELQAWLRTLLLNNLSNFHRRYRGTARRSVSREVSAEAPGGLETWLADPQGPADPAETRDQLELLRGLIARLPADYNRVLTLWYEEKTFEEIGPLMNRSTNAARMLWMRAVQRLQEMMGDEE